MARIITKELAIKIAKKLKAEVITESTAHDMAYVHHEGRLVASFGIRRAANKDKGHDHVPQAIHLGPHQARLLGQCPMSRNEWIRLMIDKGIIEILG